MGLDTVELVMAFEEDFAIDIPNEAAESMVTVGDVVDYICGELGRRGDRPDAAAVYRRVIDITARHLNIDRDRITRSSSFVRDLGAS